MIWNADSKWIRCCLKVKENENHHAKVMILTHCTGREVFERAMKAGVHGIIKDSPSEDLAGSKFVMNEGKREVFQFNVWLMQEQNPIVRSRKGKYCLLAKEGKDGKRKCEGHLSFRRAQYVIIFLKY